MRYPSGKWYVCISCEVPSTRLKDAAQLTGFDLGLTNYLTSSDGTVTEPLRAMRKAEKRIRREDRRLSRKAKGSKRREKQRVKRARLHERVANRRRDHLHKVSCQVVDTYERFRLREATNQEHAEKPLSGQVHSGCRMVHIPEYGGVQG